MNTAQGGHRTGQCFPVSGSWVIFLTWLSCLPFAVLQYSTSSSAHISLVTKLHQIFLHGASLHYFSPFLFITRSQQLGLASESVLSPFSSSPAAPWSGLSHFTPLNRHQQFEVLEPHLLVCVHTSLSPLPLGCTPSVDRYLLPLAGSPA